MIGWVDASSGASGDMLLAALLDAGASEADIAEAISLVSPEHVGLTSQRVRRCGLDALSVHVDVAESTVRRGLDDILELIDAARLPPSVARHSSEVFTRLADVEADAHGVDISEVHFHELGALDAIADIVGVCAGLDSLRLAALHGSPIAVGSGTVSTSHGQLSVPPPAVAALLVGIPTYAGPQPMTPRPGELCTPTGAALLSHFVSQWGPQPPMAVSRIGSGAGARDFTSHPNVLRLFVGVAAGVETGETAEGGTEAGVDDIRAVVLETNVDDLDPRLWPAVLQHLLGAGASDAWLTPILMKKGRPAHTLSVLTYADRLQAVESVVFAETSAIGLRRVDVAKVALEREVSEVDVGGQRIGVKLARRDGLIVNVQPEFDDVSAAASALDRSAKSVLAEAAAAARDLWRA